MDAQAAAHYRRSKRLGAVPFPAKIEALPHIVKAIDILLMSPADAIVEAARTGEQSWLRSLLEEYGYGVLKVAIVAGAQDGYIDATRVLSLEIIGQKSNLDYESWRVLTDAAIAAASRGHVAVVRFLLDQIEAGDEDSDDESNEVSNDASWQVMDEAAASEQLQVVKLAAEYAKESESSAPASERSHALRLAISGGCTDIVSFLLEPGRYSWSYDEALEQAIDTEHREIADLIYAKCPPKYTQGKSFFTCLAEDGNLKAVTYLYNNGQVLAALVDEALVSSAQAGWEDVATLLLESGSVSAKALNSAFELAASHAAIATVKLLYGQGRVSATSLIAAFKSTGSVAVVKFLHENKRIPAEVVTTAFQNASCGGWRNGIFHRRTPETDEIAKYLSGERCIPAEVINEAFEKAAEKGDSTLTEALLGDRIFPEVMAKALLNAATTGSIDIVRLLFGSPGLPWSAKQEALLTAARSNQNQVAQYLATREKWPVEVLNEALNVTTHKKLKRYLCTNFSLE